MIKLLNILRSNVIRAVTCSLILIHLFNSSIDYHSSLQPDISSKDEIESIAELMCEEILNLSDIFSDVEETGSDKSNTTGMHLFFISSNLLTAKHQYFIQTTERLNSVKPLFITSFILEINTPPPEDFCVKS